MGMRVGSSLVYAGLRRGGVEDRLGRDKKTLEGDKGTTRWQLGQGCDVWPPQKGQKRGDWHAREGILGVTPGLEKAGHRCGERWQHGGCPSPPLLSSGIHI